jgi:hypothetical protein
LEGPEHGVYLRGNTTNKEILLPDYWMNLVYIDSITVQLTPINNTIVHFVTKIENNIVYIDSANGIINASFLIIAERKDTDRFTIEYQAPEVLSM